MGEALRPQDPRGARLNDNGRVNMNIAESDGPLVLLPLPPGHMFVVISRLMQMLTTRGLFEGFQDNDPHAHISKLNHGCKSFIVRADWDMNIIGLRVLPLSLTG